MTIMIKNSYRYTFIITSIFFALVFTNCSDDDPSDIGNANVGEIRARINQNVFSVSGENTNAFLFNDVLTIIGTDAVSGEELILTAGNVINTGVIDLSGNNSMSNGSYMANEEEAFNSTADGGGGSMEITILNIENQLISGSFEFTGTRPDPINMDEEGNSINESQFVASGSFNALDLQFSIPNNPDNVFSASIDGQPFIPTAVQARALVTGGVTTISIVALDIESEQSISLSIPLEAMGNETFDIFPALGNTTGQYIADVFADPSTIFSAAGSVNVTENTIETRSMSGNFQFTATDFTGTNEDTFEISEGSFAIFY